MRVRMKSALLVPTPALRSSPSSVFSFALSLFVFSFLSLTISFTLFSHHFYFRLSLSFFIFLSVSVFFLVFFLFVFLCFLLSTCFYLLLLLCVGYKLLYRKKPSNVDLLNCESVWNWLLGPEFGCWGVWSSLLPPLLSPSILSPFSPVSYREGFYVVHPSPLWAISSLMVGSVDSPVLFQCSSLILLFELFLEPEDIISMSILQNKMHPSVPVWLHLEESG